MPETLFDDWPRYLALAYDAHQNHARTEKGRFRRHDGQTPYFVHPLWASTTLMHEQVIEVEVRWIGARALLLHDVKEDTTLEIPDWVPPEIVRWVDEMTFVSFEDEVDRIWGRHRFTVLLKLYDKVSNLIDSSWMESRLPEYRQKYVDFTGRLAGSVLNGWGELAIVKFANAVCDGWKEV